MDASIPVARAVAIAGERVAGGVGTHETALATPDRVDLGGRCVLPGLSDARVHFPSWSLAQREVRLEDTSSLEETLQRGAAAGGSDDEFVDAMRAGLRIASSRGVTAVHDKDGWLGAPRLWQRLAEEGGLTLRVWQSLPYDFVGQLEELGLRSGLGDDRLRIGYLKVFMDGTLGSQTARLLDGSGVQITSSEELAEIVRAGARAGWPVAVHAIGDLANRDALDAFEETRAEWAPLGLRPRIEHAQLLSEQDIPRFGELGVAASVQFSHAPSDRDIADRNWAGKTERAYAYRSLLDTGAVVANGS